MTLPTDFIPQPNHFYVSGTISGDQIFRTQYGDSYDGGTASGLIDAGPNEKIYVAQSETPVYNQRYEDGEWSSLHLATYTNDIQQNRNFITPQYKIYPVNPNAKLTEGSMNILDENLTVFSSYINDDNTFISEDFSGKNKGFGDRDNYTKAVVTAQTAASTDFRYTINGKQIMAALENQNEFSPRKGGSVAKSFGKRALVDGGRGEWSYNIRSNDSGLYYIEGAGTTSDGAVATVADGGWDDVWVNIEKYLNKIGNHSLQWFIDNGATANENVNLYQTQYNVVDVEFVDRVTQFNSIFNYVRESPDAEDIKVQTVGTGGDDSKFFTYSKVGFDAGDKLTGGASASFVNFWENWSGTTATTPYATQFGTAADGGILPQTCMASIDYLPQTFQLDIGGSGLSTRGKNDPVISPELSMDMKFEAMSPVLNTYSAPFLGATRLERGFAIIFAQNYPEVNESFMSYIERLRRYNEVCTGLFFYSPRDSPAEKIIGIPFMNMISGAAIPDVPQNYSMAQPGAQMSLMFDIDDEGRFVTSGNSNNPGVYSQGGNRNYFEFPANEWLNLSFKFGPVNNFGRYSGSVAGHWDRDYTSKDWIMAYSNNTTRDGAMQSVKLNLGDSHFGLNSSGTALQLNAVSFWNNNVRANKAQSAPTVAPFNNTNYDAAGFRDKDMFSTVKIDNINFKYYNWDVYNSTICDNNTIQSAVKIPSPSAVVPSPMIGATGTSWPSNFGLSGAVGPADNYFGQKSSMTHSNICIGFDELPDLTNGDAHSSGNIGVLMGGYSATKEENVRGIDGPYWSGSYSKVSGGHIMDGIGVDAMAYFTPGVSVVGDTYNLDKVGFVVSGAGGMSVDGFTQKGYLWATGLANISDTWGKRENIYASARITGSNEDGTIIKVDNPAIFDLPLGAGKRGGTDYCMWKLQYQTDAYAGTELEPEWTCGVSGTVSQHGGPVGVNGVFQIRKREGNTIFLNRPTKAADNDGFNLNTMSTSNLAGLGSGTFVSGAYFNSSKRQLGNIFISPIKYWLNIHLANVSTQESYGGITVQDEWGGWFNPANGLSGSGSRVQELNGSRSYGALLTTTGATALSSGTIGSTWNEWLYTDGQYTKEWNLSNTNAGKILEVDDDYGYGAYLNDTNNMVAYGGYINSIFPIENSYTFADLSKYIKVKSPTWETPFNYSLYPYFEKTNIENNYSIGIDTKEGTNVPFLLWGFKDDPPIISNLRVEPNTPILDTENPFEIPPNKLNTVKISWDEEKSEDIWYRFLIADNSPIFDKYHKASFYSHLNSSSASTQNYRYNNSYINQYISAYNESLWLNSGNVGVTYEGFEGYGVKFNGSGTLDTGYEDAAFTTFTNKFSLLTHIVPQSISGTIFEVVSASGAGGSSGTKLQIAISSNRVVANIYEQPGGGESNPNISSTTHLTGTTYFACDGSEDIVIGLTYDGELDAGNWKLYINSLEEDSQTYTTVSGTGGNGRAIAISGYPTLGGRRLPTSGAKIGSWDHYTGRIEEIVTWNGIVLYFPTKNEFILDTSTLLDYGYASGSYISGTKGVNNYTTRVFAIDKHNIRGRTARTLGMSNQAGWRVTGI